METVSWVTNQSLYNTFSFPLFYQPKNPNEELVLYQLVGYRCLCWIFNPGTITVLNDNANTVYCLLDWTPHINQLCKKLSQWYSYVIICRIKQITGVHSVKTVYFAIFLVISSILHSSLEMIANSTLRTIIIQQKKVNDSKPSNQPQRAFLHTKNMTVTSIYMREVIFVQSSPINSDLEIDTYRYYTQNVSILCICPKPS